MSFVNVEDDMPRNVLPPVALKAMGFLLAVVLVLAVVARLTGIGSVTAADLTTGDPVAERLIAFQPEDEGGVVRLTDGASGAILRELPPGEGGFLRGAVRPLNRERMRAGIAPEAPYRLTAWADGALTLTDPGTGVVVDLNAFGPTNAQAFAGLLPGAPSVSRRTLPSNPHEGEAHP